jgi:hypothetical protein
MSRLGQTFVARPVSVSQGVPLGTYAIKRYGDVNDETVRTERVEIP